MALFHTSVKQIYFPMHSSSTKPHFHYVTHRNKRKTLIFEYARPRIYVQCILTRRPTTHPRKDRDLYAQVPSRDDQNVKCFYT